MWMSSDVYNSSTPEFLWCNVWNVVLSWVTDTWYVDSGSKWKPDTNKSKGFQMQPCRIILQSCISYLGETHNIFSTNWGKPEWAPTLAGLHCKMCVCCWDSKQMRQLSYNRHVFTCMRASLVTKAIPPSKYIINSAIMCTFLGWNPYIPWIHCNIAVLISMTVLLYMHEKKPCYQAFLRDSF